MKRLLIPLLLFSTLTFTACGSAMTEADKQWEEKTIDMARQIVESEADSYDDYSDVETGEPEYLYTLYTDEADEYLVQYVAKFDVERWEDVSWLSIELILDPDGNRISFETSQMDDENYKITTDTKVVSAGIGQYHWTNINNLDD